MVKIITNTITTQKAIRLRVNKVIAAGNKKIISKSNIR
jgi:hypothetical protein